MRIHTDQNTWSNLMEAARSARVSFDRMESFNSSIRESGFDITLRGESRRAPNFGTGPRSSGEFAATWDQWGVFLGVLFDIDPLMVCGTPKRPAYASGVDFEHQTGSRFDVPGEFPDDAHGDHTFQFRGVAGEQSCTKCSAVSRWVNGVDDDAV